MTDHVRQADHLALHAGRRNSLDKMAAEVSTVARTRNKNDTVSMDVSVLKEKGKGKDGKGETKGKDGKDKVESKSSCPNKDKKFFYCDKIGHVKADCRKKKIDGEERKTTLPQNSLTSSSDARSPPGLTNVTTSTSGASTLSLRQLTVPSHVSDDDFYSPMRIFALNAGLHVDRVMVDSGAAHSACPLDCANEHEIRETQRKIQFQTSAANSWSIMVRNLSRTRLRTLSWESRTKSLILKVWLQLCRP